MTDVVKILRAFRPGDVVFLETDHVISAEAADRCKVNINKALEGTGICAVLLGGGLRIAAAEETRLVVPE